LLKSELVLRIAARKAHLYPRDVAMIVNAILGEILAALARGDVSNSVVSRPAFLHCSE
jgi:nucleoid DNA-binding protein